MKWCKWSEWTRAPEMARLKTNRVFLRARLTCGTDYEKYTQVSLTSPSLSFFLSGLCEENEHRDQGQKHGGISNNNVNMGFVRMY